MLKQIQMVREFHLAFGAPVADEPAICPDERLILRGRLIFEEACEFLEAAGLDGQIPIDEGSEKFNHGEVNFIKARQANMVEMADALMDLLYVTYGTIVELGLQSRAKVMFKHVHDSNMSKLGEDGKPIVREDGKVLKGPKFFPPRLDQFLLNPAPVQAEDFGHADCEICKEAREESHD